MDCWEMKMERQLNCEPNFSIILHRSKAYEKSNEAVDWNNFILSRSIANFLKRTCRNLQMEG